MPKQDSNTFRTAAGQPTQNSGTRPAQWPARRLAPRAVAGLCMGFLVCGCTVLSYRGPNGERFSRCALGNNTSLSSLLFESGTNGLRRVELRGYRNDASQALGAVTEAAVRAAIQAH